MKIYLVNGFVINIIEARSYELQGNAAIIGQLSKYICISYLFPNELKDNISQNVSIAQVI
jgi:hypothetical protein